MASAIMKNLFSPLSFQSSFFSQETDRFLAQCPLKKHRHRQSVKDQIHDKKEKKTIVEFSVVHDFKRRVNTSPLLTKGTSVMSIHYCRIKSF